MNKYQKKLRLTINCMPAVIPLKKRRMIAAEALKQPANNNFRIIVEQTNKYIWGLVKDKRCRHWSETYPHELIASAVLDKNNLLCNWKVGYHSFESYWINNDYQVKIKIWCVNNDTEHDKVFETLAKQWFKNFKIAKNFNGDMPY